MYDITELNTKKVDDLRAIAKDLSVPQFAKLKKEGGMRPVNGPAVLG